MFNPHIRGELGRGGHYTIDEEPAVGATLYVASLLRGLPATLSRKEPLFATINTPQEQIDKARAKGQRVIRLFDDNVPQGASLLTSAF